MDLEEFKDLPKKYISTYIRFREKGSDEPWKVVYVENLQLKNNDDGNPHRYVIKTIEGWLNDRDFVFSFDFPPIGVLNYENTVVIASKYPARQWKKAATNENYVVYLPTEELLHLIYHNYVVPKFVTNSFKWNVGDIQQLFDSKYYSFEEAVQLLSKGQRQAAAITEEFFLTNSHYNTSLLLWRYNSIVAEIENNRVTNILAPLFEQEIKDLFKRKVNASPTSV